MHPPYLCGGMLAARARHIVLRRRCGPPAAAVALAASGRCYCQPPPAQSPPRPAAIDVDERLARMRLKYSLETESQTKRRRRWLTAEVRAADQEMYDMGTTLYYQAATGFDLAFFIAEFRLADSFISWFRLCVLRVWLALLRCAGALDLDRFAAVRDTVLGLLWHDCEHKLAALAHETGSAFGTNWTLRTLHATMLHMIIELDEGVVTDDQTLAGSVWRTLYDCSADADPVALAKLVRYIRQQVHQLDGIPLSALRAHGVPHWKRDDSAPPPPPAR